jgi:hypothetical protein
VIKARVLQLNRNKLFGAKQGSHLLMGGYIRAEAIPTEKNIARKEGISLSLKSSF